MFAETHRLALALVREGLVDGLRIDHPDGLADPAGYLERLRDGGAAHVWVEKILDPGEPLRDWPVEGTVGYEFLFDVAALFVDPAGEAPLTALWEELAGDARPFGAWAAGGQARAGAQDVRARRRAGCGALRPGAEGLEEALAALPVYRTYIRDAAGAARTCTCCARRGSTSGSPSAPAAVRHALPADDAAGHGQGRRGHRVLPLRAAARAQRRRRRPEPLVDRRRRLPRRQRASAPRASRATCSPRRRTTRSARATCARGSARSPALAEEWVAAGAALAGAVRAAARGRRARRDRGVHDLPDARWARGRSSPTGCAPTWRRRCARRKRDTSWVEPDAGARGARARLLPRALRPRAVPGGVRAVRRARRASLGELHALRQTALQADRAGRARRLPGRRARRALARRPRQPPPGRLGAPRASCSPSCATAPRR